MDLLLSLITNRYSLYSSFPPSLCSVAVAPDCWMLMQPRRSWHTGRVCVSRVRYSYTRIPLGCPARSHQPIREQEWWHSTNQRPHRALSISATASDSSDAGRGVSWGRLRDENQPSKVKLVESQCMSIEVRNKISSSFNAFSVTI